MKLTCAITTIAVFCSTLICSGQNTAHSEVPAADNTMKLPKRGYSGDVGFSIGTAFSDGGAKPICNISTTHGFQFNRRFFLGAGVSALHIQFLALYATVNGALRKPTVNKPSYPYLTANIGYNVSTWAGERFADEKGVYFEPRFGWSFYSKSGNIRYNTYASFIYYQFSVYPQIGISFQF